MVLTDLHLHLLPGVDDGPRSVDESLEVARDLVADGISRCVVTPHFNAWNPSFLTTADEVVEAVGELIPVLAAHHIPLEVYPGAEHFLTPELVVAVQRGEAPLLGPGPYILVELPFDSRPLYMEDLLYQLHLLGLSPVLAHPARYSWVQANPEAIQPIIAAGTHLQLTAGSLGGQYGSRVKRTAEAMLRRGWYSLPGTDTHHPGQKRSLTAMFEDVRSLGGETAAQMLLIENPGRVLSGEPLLPVPAFEEGETSRKRFRLFG